MDFWDSVRREFRTDPDVVNLAHFLFASHPRAVRAEIDRLAKWLDFNTSVLDMKSIPENYQKAADAVADFTGANADDLAFVQSTTTGLGVVYSGLKLRADQEILISDQDHVSHHESVRIATERVGATMRVGNPYEDSDKATVDEIAERFRTAITPRTRAVGVTWVQSSTGVRMPVRAIAEVVAEANRGRAEQDRCLLIVDGVHGLGAVDEDISQLSADAFVAGTHKWLWGPRGTGIVWVKPDAIQHIVPIVLSFDQRSPASLLGLGGFATYDHLFALPAAMEFMQKLGRAQVAGRITELSTRVRDGLAEMRGVKLRTPRDPALSAGFTMFDVDGLRGGQVVEHLAKKRIQISTAFYRIPYARISTAMINTPAEVDKALRAVAELPR